MLPVEKATYRARAASSAGFGWSSNKNSQVAIECVVTAGDYTGDRITWIGVFGPESTDRTIESLQIMGWKGDDLAELEEGCDVAKLMPDEFDLVCGPDDRDPTKLKANWVNRPGGGRFSFKEKMGPGELKGFAASMKDAIRNARGPQAKKPAQQQPRNGSGGYGGGSRHPNAPAGPDDDNPFATAGIGAEPSPIARVLR